MRLTVRSLMLLILFALCLHLAQAQSNEKKFEVGGQFSLLQGTSRTVTATVFPCLVAPCPGTAAFSGGHVTEPGFGGRFGYNVSKYLAVEAEGNFFPRDNVLEDGKKVQGFFGVKAGKRFDKFGLFAKARPGFARYERGDYVFGTGGCLAVFPPPIGCYQPVARTNFAIDLGGVFEYYPSKRTIIRIDAGDTIVRLPARNVAAFQTNATSVFTLVVLPANAETAHHFQGSVGFGFRF